jgi:hypothetical protein
MRLTPTKKVSAFIQLVNAFWFSFARRNMIVFVVTGVEIWASFGSR